MTTEPRCDAPACHPPALAFKLESWLQETQARILAEAAKEKDNKGVDNA